MRSVFLKKYMDNLASSTPRPVVFLDETGIYSKGNKGKSWQNDSVKSVRKIEGYDAHIELIWASAKGYYDKHIGRDGYPDENVFTVWSEALEHCCQNTWKNCAKHTNKLMRDWYERKKHIADIEIDPIIINPAESSTLEEEFESH
ncbi:hypothetical protein QE152_g13646 [Popillia japonica]|uniref:Transposase n=1 Tax=Popillia japonica TaxID=7064 RepID=A0AAW1LD19_POPJA